MLIYILIFHRRIIVINFIMLKINNKIKNNLIFKILSYLCLVIIKYYIVKNYYKILIVIASILDMYYNLNNT